MRICELRSNEDRSDRTYDEFVPFVNIIQMSGVAVRQIISAVNISPQFLQKSIGICV